MREKAHKLLEHEMKDMYDAEQRFVDALGTMIDNAHDRSLADGFRRHREVTKGQVKRLERVFDEIGIRPQRVECPAARGLVREYEKFVEQEPSGDGMLDTFAATSGLKVEHYEIASYRSMIDLAVFCDYNGAARLLKQNLAEEEQAAAEMQVAATKLTAKLADAPLTAVAGRTVGKMVDQVREGTMNTVGGVIAVGDRAVGSARGAVRKAERRGRKKVTSAKRGRTSTSKRATSKARGTAKKAKKTAKRATSKARTTARATARRATSTTRRTARSSTGPASRRTSARRRSAKRTTARRTSR